MVLSFKKSLRASESDGCTVSHRLSSFLFTYRTTPHASTNTTPSELFLKRPLRTHLDLLHPNVETTVYLSQAKQKAQHDHHVKERAFNVVQAVLAKNFQSGTTISGYQAQLYRKLDL